MDIQNTEKYIISESSSVLDAIQKLENLSGKIAMVLFVVDENQKVIGSLTDGDVRRGILKGIKLSDNVQNIMKKSFYYLKINEINLNTLHDLRNQNIKLIPLLNDQGFIEKFVDLTQTRSILPVNCVIMAGGKGLRLRPYTDDTPKPLLLLNEKPIIIHNIDRLILYGVKKFYVSVNHMKEKIKSYLNSYYSNKDISIEYLEEEFPMGTLGSINLAKDFPFEDILVINADLLTNIDYEDYYLTYLKEKNSMSVATFNVKVDIPYAVLETEENKISSLIEKPTYVYYSNAGIYLFKKDFLNLIPQNSAYDAIDLVEELIKQGEKVSQYPIRGYWLDIGKPDNYRKAQDDIDHIKF